MGGGGIQGAGADPRRPGDSGRMCLFTVGTRSFLIVRLLTPKYSSVSKLPHQMTNNRLLHGLGLLALLGATSTGLALTIGRQQGQAVLGRPLEVQVPVGLDPGMDPAQLCPEAEVFYGATRLPSRMVDVQVTGSGEVARVQLRVIPPLDEPFASVQLRVGCSQKLSRRFVLLAEDPATPPSPVAALMLPTGANLLPLANAVAPGLSSDAPDGASGASGEARTSGPSATVPVNPPPRSETRPPERPLKKAHAVTAPRLRLDPVDLPLPQSAPSATATLGGPAGAIEDMVVRNQALEAEVRQLQVALQSSHRAGTAMRGQLAQAERERFFNPVVFGLAAVSALTLLLAGLVWRRAVSVDWPRTGHRPLAARSVSNLPAALWPFTPGETSSPAVGSPSPASDESHLLAPLEDTAAAAGEGAAAASSVEEGKARTLASMNARLPEPLPLSTLELNDIQQEANFFVSLGEHDRAIELLRTHIEQHPQSSALAWLDLLEIHHKIGRRDDYEKVRRDFEWLFNVKLPSFETFGADHDDLEGHPELMSRIQAAWPAPAVLKVIDAAILRTPVDAQGKPLGLQAYRDLLFLHQLAKAPAAKAPEAMGGKAVALDGRGAHAESAAGPIDALAAAAGAPDAAVGSMVLPAASRRLTRDLNIDLDLDAILGHPAPAPDPARSAIARERFEKGLDVLIN